LPLKRGNFTDPLPPIEWILRPWIPADAVMLLAGDAGSGKSWLGLDLAIALASGQPWLGCTNGGSTGVLVLDEDGQAIGTQHRLRALARGRGLDPASLQDHIFHSIPQGLDLDNPVHYAQIVEAAMLVNARLIIGDALVALHSRDENTSGDMKAVMRSGFKRLTRDANASILLIHHHVKPSDMGLSRQNIHKVRGGGEIVAASDGLITASRTSKDAPTLIEMSRSKLIPANRWPVPLAVTVTELEQSPDGDTTSARLDYVPLQIKR